MVKTAQQEYKGRRWNVRVYSTQYLRNQESQLTGHCLIVLITLRHSDATMSPRHVHKKSTYLVVQLNVKGSGVSGDRGPLNSLTRGARQPDGVLARRGDADGVGEAEGSKERHDEGGRVHCGKLMCVIRVVIDVVESRKSDVGGL